MGAHDIDELLHGADSLQHRSIVRLLGDGRWWTLTDLVSRTATSRRGIEHLLRHLPSERSGDHVRLTSHHPLPAHDDGPGLTGPVPPADSHPRLLARMRALIDAAPRPRRALDHVSATPQTVVRRALLLGARFHMPAARLLCIGDHDLTSLAVAQLYPDAHISVVDIDDRILAYIDRQAAHLGAHIHTRWSDLRLGLPPTLRESADIALTDPPYTPQGITLFTTRALEGLRTHDSGRVLLAYGAAEHSPMLALKAQQALSALNLVFEAVFPDFNRYLGAEAIGSSADLYLLRPTTKTAPALRAQAKQRPTAIYTHGPHAVESDHTAAPPPPPDAQILVGDWSPHTGPRLPRARLATWLAKPHPHSYTRVDIALPPAGQAALPRLLLASRTPQVRLHLAEHPGGLSALRDALAPVYRLHLHDRTLEASRTPEPGDPTGRVLRSILDHAHGKLANTWREALLREDATLTKKTARLRVLRTAPWARDVTPLELPLHRLAELPEHVAQTLRP